MLSILLGCGVLALVGSVIVLLKDEPDLSGLTMDELVDLNYHATMHGDYPNIYSREFMRRCNVDNKENKL